jgi:hypothetical protein
MNAKLALTVILSILISSSAFSKARERTFRTSSNKKMDFRGGYLVGALGSPSINYSQKTHIIVVGSSKKKDSDQFFKSGVIKAYRYKNLNKDAQVVFISSPDVRRTKNYKVFEKYGIAISKGVEHTLTAYQMARQMELFSQIESFDYFGHSSPWAIKLDMDGTLDPKKEKHSGYMIDLKDNFTPSAFATLNGCNGGFILAPKFSHFWGIPVSGTLTSTNFETLKSNGKWYKEYDGKRKDNAYENKLSFQETMSCKAGVCTRLMPSRYYYGSYWGEFKEGGLGFSKTFCQFNDQEKCLKNMGRSLLAHPSSLALTAQSSLSDYKEVLIDFLCSEGRKSSIFKTCRDKILAAHNQKNMILKVFSSNALNCDFNSCNAEVVCRYKRKEKIKGSCHLRTTPNTRPTTVMREFNAYLKAFELLKTEGLFL